MNAEEFVQAIKQAMSNNVLGLIKFIENPPGRSPSQSSLRISKFYNGLNDVDKKTFQEALELAVGQSMDNFLCILDGSLAIESGEKKGELELFYTDGESRTRLNDPEGNPLSDIFGSQ